MIYTSAGLTTRLVWSALDSLIWIGSLVIATWLRLDFHITDQYWTPLLVGCGIAVFVHLVDGLTVVDPDADPLADLDASWVRQVAAAAARRRGSIVARQSGVDITDPIGGPPSAFGQMANEVDAALVPIVRALRDLPGSPRST